MDRNARLLHLLRGRFPHASLEIMDDSAEHAGHAHGQSGETHYRLRIRDATFTGMPRLQMHRQIMAAVQSEMDAGLHSFVIESCGAE